MPRSIPFEVQEDLFDLICAGLPLLHAADWTGVSYDTATRLWRQRGVMGLQIAMGARGGIHGSAPVRHPGDDRPVRRRRPLTAEDRAVIAALVNRGVSLRENCRVLGRDE